MEEFATTEGANAYASQLIKAKTIRTPCAINVKGTMKLLCFKKREALSLFSLTSKA